MSDFHLQPATPADLPALVALNGVVQRLHVAARPDVFRVPETRAVEAWLREKLDEPTTAVWVARDDEEALGYLLAFDTSRPENPFCHARRTLILDQIAVAPSARRRGVARALIDAAAAHAEREGIPNVELSVWAFNETARDAFTRVGFVPRLLFLERQPM